MIILQKPLITEKSMKLADKSKYSFLVAKSANKESIAKFVAEKFGVKVLGVKTVNVKGKRLMQRRVRKFYTTPNFKKAIVEVKAGQKIALFETPKEEEVVVTKGEAEPVILKDKKDLLRRTKVRVEKGATGAAPTTQRKVITGK